MMHQEFFQRSISDVEKRQTFLVVCLISLIADLTFIYCWKRRHLYTAAQRLRGPLAFPIIGNAYVFFGKNEDLLMRLYKAICQYLEEPFRFWLGPWLLIVLPNPDHVGKILSSSKFSQKHDIYQFPKIVAGEGLVTASGPTHKRHRKIIQPMVDLDFVRESTNFIQKHVTVCMQKLEPYLDEGNFDFFHVVYPCMADIMKEIILGSDERSQISGITEFDQATLDSSDFLFTRMVKVWQHSDFLFNLTPLKTRQTELADIIKSKGKKMVEEAFNRKRSLKPSKEFQALIDRIVDYIEDNPDAIDFETLADHIFTLYVASEDTMSLISSFLSMCLGMCPEVQEKAAEEIRDVFGETPRPVTTDDIPKLHYISMCIKETLRMFPVTPFILRNCREDFELGKWLIPNGCGLVIPIFNIHRDPRAWEKPHEFYPEHFLPEAVAKRHVYSYIPFSAGPRGCIGKILADTGLEVFMCNLLQRYELEADGKIEDFKLKMDLSTKSVNGYYLRIKKRVWK